MVHSIADCDFVHRLRTVSIICPSSALLCASISWAAGSLYARSAPLARSPLLSAGTQMIAGGIALLLLGLLTGEPSHLHLAAVSARSVAALTYLVIFGSLMGFSAYSWLVTVAAPARVATYAYVNPVIAVLLGWAIAGEAITMRIAVAAAVIIGAVALIVADQAKTWGSLPTTGEHLATRTLDTSAATRERRSA